MAGNSDNLDWFRGEITARMDVKFRARLSGDSGDDKSVRILDRIVEWTKEGIMYDADHRHAEIITREAGIIEGSKAVVTLGTEVGDDEAKDGFEKSAYRSISGRANYLSQDRMDIQFAVKEICRKISDPCREDWPPIKRLARYLQGVPRIGIMFKLQDKPGVIDVWTDTFCGMHEDKKIDERRSDTERGSLYQDLE